MKFSVLAHARARKRKETFTGKNMAKKKKLTNIFTNHLIAISQCRSQQTVSTLLTISCKNHINAVIGNNVSTDIIKVQKWHKSMQKKLSCCCLHKCSNIPRVFFCKGISDRTMCQASQDKTHSPRRHASTLIALSQHSEAKLTVHKSHKYPGHLIYSHPRLKYFALGIPGGFFSPPKAREYARGPSHHVHCVFPHWLSLSRIPLCTFITPITPG